MTPESFDLYDQVPLAEIGKIAGLPAPEPGSEAGHTVLAWDSGAAFLYRIDHTDDDFRLWSPESFTWSVRSGLKRLTVDVTPEGRLSMTRAAHALHADHVSNVTVIESEPGAAMAQLRRNGKPSRRDQGRVSSLYLFARSAEDTPALYLGRMWLEEVSWQLRDWDGHELNPARGTRSFEILPRIAKAAWCSAGGYLWRLRVGWDHHEARTVEETLALLKLLDGDAPKAAELNRHEDDSLIIFVGQDQAAVVYNRFEFIINPDYDGDPDLILDNRVFRYENGQELECPAAAILPRDRAMRLVAEMVQTGERPAQVEWRSFNFYV